MSRKEYDIDNFPGEYETYRVLPSGLTICEINLPTIHLPDNSNQEDVEKAKREQLVNWMNSDSVQRAIVYGKYGWAMYDNTTDKKFLKPLVESIRNKSLNQNVDTAIDKLFKNRDLLSIYKELILLLAGDNDSLKKLNVAIRLFKKKKYYESANILFELIDARSIQILITRQQSNTKQGVRSMSKVLKLKFGNFLNMAEADESNNKDAMKELFEKLPEYVATESFENDWMAYEVINLAYTFKTLFDSCDWENTNLRPAAINRNCLMHGMYDYDEITRYDCIKILFLLRKLLQVYSYSDA